MAKLMYPAPYELYGGIAPFIRIKRGAERRTNPRVQAETLPIGVCANLAPVEVAMREFGPQPGFHAARATGGFKPFASAFQYHVAAHELHEPSSADNGLACEISIDVGWGLLSLLPESHLVVKVTQPAHATAGGGGPTEEQKLHTALSLNDLLR